MDWRDEAERALPSPRPNEPRCLRDEILDELADHLACSVEDECSRPGAPTDEEEIWRRVLERFGSVNAVARQLWFDAMKGSIMRDWIHTGILVVLAVAVVGFMGLMARNFQQMNQQLIEAIRAPQESAADRLPRLEVVVNNIDEYRADGDGIELSLYGKAFTEDLITLLEPLGNGSHVQFGPIEPGPYRLTLDVGEWLFYRPTDLMLYRGNDLDTHTVDLPTRIPTEIDIDLRGVKAFKDESYQVAIAFSNSWSRDDLAVQTRTSAVRTASGWQPGTIHGYDDLTPRLTTGLNGKWAYMGRSRNEMRIRTVETHEGIVRVDAFSAGQNVLDVSYVFLATASGTRFYEPDQVSASVVFNAGEKASITINASDDLIKKANELLWEHISTEVLDGADPDIARVFIAQYQDSHELVAALALEHWEVDAMGNPKVEHRAGEKNSAHVYADRGVHFTLVDDFRKVEIPEGGKLLLWLPCERKISVRTRGRQGVSFIQPPRVEAESIGLDRLGAYVRAKSGGTPNGESVADTEPAWIPLASDPNAEDWEYYDLTEWYAALPEDAIKAGFLFHLGDKRQEEDAAEKPVEYARALELIAPAGAKEHPEYAPRLVVLAPRKDGSST